MVGGIIRIGVDVFRVERIWLLARSQSFLAHWQDFTRLAAVLCALAWYAAII
jgi:hypothetical protein